MRKLGKSFLMILMLICMFSYMGVVNAATPKLKEVEADSITAVENLLLGSQLSEADSATISTLMGKYTLYYKYQKISSDVYSKYKSNPSDSTVGSSVANAVEDITTKVTDPSKYKEYLDDTTNGWSAVDKTQKRVIYSELEYSEDNPAGYLVVLTALSKTDNTKIYDYRSVYQATSATTLATYSSTVKETSISDEENEVDKENSSEETDLDSEEPTDEERDADTEEKAESNPETGISDLAIYLVPISLVAGSALMIKRRYI